MNKGIKIASALALLAVGAAAGAWYWQQAGKLRSTENAYVNADIVQVASQISGQVSNVYVKEGQLVKAGQALFEIDPAPFKLALAQAEAKLVEARQSTREDVTNVTADGAAVSQAEADLKNARNTAARTHSLVLQNFLSRQADDDAQAKIAVAEAAVSQARAKLAGAQVHVTPVGGTTAAVLAARAQIEQARLDLAHTQVAASKDGWITSLSLVQGSTVNPNTPLFALIAQGSFWIDANFKETELPGIAPGKPAQIEIDMDPDHAYRGVVETIGQGTGAAFSLLPAQNATGNWVKVTQRVPVRIRFAANETPPVLRVGASAHVSVQIKS